MKNHLVFDVETNGLPVSHTARFTEVDNWPRIAQISWGLYDDAGQELVKKTYMVKPDRWTVPTSPFFIEHNMSTERCEAEGRPLPEIIAELLESWDKADVLVAHNLSFDRAVLFAELIRYGIRPSKKLAYYCTKLATEPILRLPGYKGKFKWPKLIEAHEYFFGCGFDGAHDAGADVDACARVYFKCLEYDAAKEFF